LIIVDVSASTGAFVGTVCLIAVRRSVSGRTGLVVVVGESVRPLVFVHRLVFLICIASLIHLSTPLLT